MRSRVAGFLWIRTMFVYFRSPVGWRELARRTIAEILDDDCMGLAAKLAFYFFLAVFPALVFLVSVLAYAPVEPAIAAMLERLDPFLPEDVLATLRAPVNLAALNSEHSDSDIYVDPDERFIVFHRSIDAAGAIDFWIAFNDAGRWRAPRPLDVVNATGWELSPAVSPDGRYFFFARDGAVYQLDFCALVRPEGLPGRSEPAKLG